MRRCHRRKDLDVRGQLRSLRKRNVVCRGEKSFRVLACVRFRSQQHEVRERRQAAGAALIKQLARESAIVVT